MTNETTTLVDSNVLLDIVTDEPTWSAWSSNALEAFDSGRVVVNPIVYAEVSVGFDLIENLDDALPATQFLREPLPYAAGFLAGKAFLAYRRRGGSRLAPLPDFYVGAHAALSDYRLLTRDAQRYDRSPPLRVGSGTWRSRPRQAQNRIRGPPRCAAVGRQRLRLRTDVGEPCDPRNALRAPRSWRKRPAWTEWGLPTLRHSAASVMLSNGVPITVGVHGHVAPDVSRDALDVLATALGSSRGT